MSIISSTFPELLHHSLSERALQIPDKAAVIVSDTIFTYSQLERASTKLAAYLLSEGVQKGDRVAIYAENNWPSVIAIYAVLRLGGVFLVVNPQTKSEKLSYILNDCSAVALVSEQHLGRHFTSVLDQCEALTVLVVSAPPDVVDVSYSGVLSHHRLESIVSPSTISSTFVEPTITEAIAVSETIPSDLCALIYTSGTTGDPKGVMHTHQSMVFARQSLLTYLCMSSDDRIMNVLPLAFDYGLYQLLMSVHLGATLVLERSFAFPEAIFARILDYKVTVFPGVPTLYAMLIRRHHKKKLSFDTVRLMTNTAAALSSTYLKDLQVIFPNALIFKMYGLTECKRVSYLAPQLLSQKPDSVGKAIPGTEVYLSDQPGGAKLEFMERDSYISGILHVRGPHLMRGYWGRPELTAHMLKSGFLQGEQVLCTHDQFRMDKEGFLYFIGRTDDIIKSRGEKVSPLEVENFLLGLELVEQAVVIGVEDSILGESVVAFVVLKLRNSSDYFTDQRQIKAACVAGLENFMIPKNIQIVSELPKTPNGKVDKKTLRLQFTEGK